MHFRWGVALVGEFFIGHCSPHRGEIFLGTGGILGEDTDPRTKLSKRPECGYLCVL